MAAARSDAPIPVTGFARQQGSRQQESLQQGSVPPFAISVDDGGLSAYSLLAPCLDEFAWSGNFLITTGWLGKPGFLHKHHLRELHAAGHLIGTHSVTHPPRFHTCSPEQLVAEWGRSKATLEDIIGAPVVVGSIPGGFYSRRVVQAAQEAGLEILLTSEPQTSPHDIDGCRVFGRYTLRRDSPADLAGRLVQSPVSARWRQWLAWNGKKVLKKSLGTEYARLAGWWVR